MRRRDEDLDAFLAVVARICKEHVTASGVGDAEELKDLLSGAGVLELGSATWTMEESLSWLTATVSTVAHSSPSLAYVLAARYAAQRVGEVLGTEVMDATFGLLHGGDPSHSDGTGQSLVPLLFAPTEVVLVDVQTGDGLVVPWSTLHEEAGRRVGLPGASLRSVTSRGTGRPVYSAVGEVAVREFAVLVAAACLGTTEAAVLASERYADARHQFGSSLTAFGGVRAMLADMHLRSAMVRALLDAVLDSEVLGEGAWELSATAGRVGVDVTLDAIQVHGGYGYIDEYPVAGWLRDAVSLQARGLGRRASLARLAGARLSGAAR